MTQQTRKRFEEFLRKRDLDGLESFWLEILETEESPSGFLDLIDLLVKSEQRELATTLLSVLISHRKEHNDHACALDALKRQAELNPNDRYLRRELINCYRQIYSTNPRLDTYLSKSELADTRPVAEAIRFLENCLAFDVDGSVYDSEQGVGKVSELDLMVDKIVVDFGRDKPVTYHTSAAFKHLVPLKPDHFLIRKRDQPENLRELSRSDPLELLKALLKGFDRALKPREIREHLRSIVPDAEWDSFWTKVSKAAVEDPEVLVHTKPERSFQWSSANGRAIATHAAEPVPEVAETETRVAPPVRRRRRQRAPKAPEPEAQRPTATGSDGREVTPPETGETFLAVEAPKATPSPSVRSDGREATPVPAPFVEAPSPASVSSDGREATPTPDEAAPAVTRSLDDYLALLKSDTSPESWKSVLAEAQQALPKDWPRLYRQAFLDTNDKRIWAMIIKQLGGQSGTFQEIVQETTTYYKKYAPHFIYLQQNAAKYGLKTDAKGLLSRLLDLLDSERHKSFWAEINNWLAEGNELLVRECFKGLTAEEAETMWVRISRMRYFEDFRKDEILKAIQTMHPKVGFTEPTIEDVIYCTREGIERKQAELRQLVDVEIPKTSEDIGRARSFGDLSENYEYKAAKEKQGRLLAKVVQMQRDLAIAHPIDFDKVMTDQVSIGTKVRVEEMPSGETQEFAILGPWDIDPDRGVISYQAPFAQRLLGKRVGDFVPANPAMPSGRGHKLLEIARAL